MSKKEELSLEERGKLANEEITATLNKYNLMIQPQVEKEDLTTFVSSLKVRLVDINSLKKDE